MSVSVSGSSRQGSLPLDVSSQASRSVSGLTNLARQLSEDLEELRELEGEDDGESGGVGFVVRRYASGSSQKIEWEWGKDSGWGERG